MRLLPPSCRSLCLVSLIALAWSCASPDTAAAGATAEPAPTSLKQGMKRIEEDWKLVEEALKANPPANLPAVAAAATKIAGAMHLAYDPFEDKEVPNFATYAREAEQAFLQLAEDAKNGRAAAVAERGATLMDQHCARCHDATEEARG